MNKESLDKQNICWEETFTSKPQMFGTNPSEAAQKAVEIFKENGVKKILELGGGQGRDTMYFAQNGFEVTVLDYTAAGIQAIRDTAKAMELSHSVTAIQHDLRTPFPFEGEIFDACYSHMLYCMAFTTRELEGIITETARILKSEGINIYTVRNTNDVDYKTGIHRGEDLYECGKFIVHFFSREKAEELAGPFTIVSMDEFEEGGLPRRLFLVVLKKEKD